ncbi:MAG: hypothetical protein DRN83_01030 [Hadesarchaea archaeon]|nr:MAG: hypothetical protein DRN83_01030 [Hadesarchaea archaeon]
MYLAGGSLYRKTRLLRSLLSEGGLNAPQQILIYLPQQYRLEVYGVPEWLVFLVSIIPFIELRGAIPLAILAGYSPELAFAACALLNLLAIPIAFVLLDFILPPILQRVELVERMFRWAVRRAQKHRNLSLLGLTLFVGIPLPITGAYMGSLIAYIAGLNRKHATVAIATGVVIAGVLIWVLASFGIIFIRGLSHKF